MALLARFARQRHPCFTAKGPECLTVLPDLCKRPIADRLERQRRDRARGMAGKGETVRRHHDVASSPSTHARLWGALVIIGHDEKNPQLTGKSLTRARDSDFRGVE